MDTKLVKLIGAYGLQWAKRF